MGRGDARGEEGRGKRKRGREKGRGSGREERRARRERRGREEAGGEGRRREGRGGDHQRQREDLAQRKATPANYQAVLALELHDC